MIGFLENDLETFCSCLWVLRDKILYIKIINLFLIFLSPYSIFCTDDKDNKRKKLN